MAAELRSEVDGSGNGAHAGDAAHDAADAAGDAAHDAADAASDVAHDAADAVGDPADAARE